MAKVSDKYNLDLFQEIVGFRADWRCEMPDCGATGHDLNPHHVEGRDNKSTRYDAEYNGIWLCYNHHCFAHNNPREFKKILIYNKVRSREWFEELTRRTNIIVKFNNSYREEWKEKLLAELKRLGVRGWRK